MWLVFYRNSHFFKAWLSLTVVLKYLSLCKLCKCRLFFQLFPCKSVYHDLIPCSLFPLLQRHSQGRDDTPLEVQDGYCLTILRVQFHIVHTLNCNLQRIPKRIYGVFKCNYYCRNIQNAKVQKSISSYSPQVMYLSISAAKASEPGAAPNTGLPSASTSITSLSLQLVVRTIKLQVWGTSISTCNRR